MRIVYEKTYNPWYIVLIPVITIVYHKDYNMYDNSYKKYDNNKIKIVISFLKFSFAFLIEKNLPTFKK